MQVAAVADTKYCIEKWIPAKMSQCDASVGVVFHL
jgi:hypothetical protein